MTVWSLYNISMKYFLTIICIMFLSLSYSQKEDYNWVFPKNIHINFNTNPPIVATVSHNLANGNCSGISDKNGNLLFYNDIRKIYNSDHQLIYSLAWTADVHKLINTIPHPTIDKNFFYISGVQIAKQTQVILLIDLNANAGKGKITETSIMDKEEYFTDRFLITRKFNSNNYWFLRFRDNKIIRNTIDASGLKNDTYVEDFMKISIVKISPDMSKLFISNYNRTKFYIADFDSKTAEIKNIRQFAEANNTGSKPIANIFEFSQNGNYLFRISNTYLNADTTKTIAIKYDMSKSNNIQSFSNSADTLNIINSTTIKDEYPADASLAPNGKIYISVPKAGYLLAIEEHNLSKVYVLNKKSLYLNGNKSLRALPHYFNYHASFSCNIECHTVTFNYSGMQAQSLQWKFGDGNSSSNQNPSHTYATPGTYTVKLTATYTDGTTQTATKTITISEKPKKPIIIHN